MVKVSFKKDSVELAKILSILLTKPIYYLCDLEQQPGHFWKGAGKNSTQLPINLNTVINDIVYRQNSPFSGCFDDHCASNFFRAFESLLFESIIYRNSTFGKLDIHQYLQGDTTKTLKEAIEESFLTLLRLFC